MKTTLYSLIVITPQGSPFRRVHISRQAVLLLALAFVLSFCTTVILLLAFPRVNVNDADDVRLAAENQSLKIDNMNAAIGVSRLTPKVSRLEEVSKRVTALMEGD